MQQATAVQRSISIPRLFPEEERDITKRVMAAWAEKQQKHAVFETGRDYIANLQGERYRFQCQRRTDANRYGFQRSALLDPNLTGFLLFRQSQEADDKYLWIFYKRESLFDGRTEGRRTITPHFDENSEDYVVLDFQDP